MSLKNMYSQAYYKDNKGMLLNIDCIEGLKMIEDETIDLIVTSPPYNLDINYLNYNDNRPIEEYCDFVNLWIKECFRVIKKGGRICINIPPDIGNLKDNSKISLDSIYYNIMLKNGFLYRTKIIWNKQQISGRTAWGSFCSPSNPNILPSYEFILVMYKDNPKKEGDKSNITIEKEDFITWTNGMWTFGCESAKKLGHPAPFPKELPNRLIQMFSYKNDIVLDPFMGSGTTSVVSEFLNRKWIGFELSKEYCDICKNRLEGN